MFSHANFGSAVGGISYPMLADFHPKGAMGDSFGVYMADKGFTMRATVIVDAKGIVKYASISDKRDMGELVKLCQSIDAEHELKSAEKSSGISESAALFVRDNCGSSRAAMLARTNLHHDSVTIKNVSDNETFQGELEKASGATTAPVLIVGDQVIKESATIIEYLLAHH